MSDAPSFPTLPVLDTHAAPDGAAAGSVVHDLALGVPRRIGPYEITGVLGSGGMGVVYRAEQHEPLRREVALKLIRRGLDTDRLIARFEAERLVLARMNHSSIARVFDAGATDDGRPFFVMELVAGAPITEFCDEHRVPVRDRLSLFVAACRAVQHAHQKGVVHRDLKPSNILVTTDEGAPAPKIIDFGIAKAIAGDDRDRLLLTDEGQLVGTPEYMSPEQAGVLEADVDTRTDVYALGVVLYELLSGRKPLRFTTGTREEVQRMLREQSTVRPSAAVGATRRLRLATATPPPDAWSEIATARQTTPERLRRTLAGDLDIIVLKAMAYEPARRYASVDQLAEDIERFLTGQPVQARPDSWTYRVRKFTARHRYAVAAVVVAAVALVGFSVLTAVQAARVARERDRAEQALARAEAVNQFLVGMFEEADPTRALGSRLTAAEVVERGSRQLERELQGQPEVKAALLLTLSRVQGSLGHWDRARGLAGDAMVLRSTAPPAALAEALTQFGDASRQAGNLQDAEDALTRALTLRLQEFGVPHLAVAQVLNNLAHVRNEQGRYKESEALHRRALAMRRQLSAAGSETVAGSLSGLGQSLRSQSRYDEAEAVYREVLTLRRASLPANHPRVLNSMRQLAQVLNYLDKNSEAEALFRDALRAADSVLGPDHPDTAGVVNDLASLLHDRGRYAEAEPLYLRAIRASRSNDSLADQATQVNNLATLYEDQGRFAAALPLYRESLAMRREARGPRHPAVATALNNLGRLLATLGDLTEAERLLGDALAIRLESNGEQHVLTARTRYNLGRILRMRGKADEALHHVDAALAIQRVRLPETHPHALATRLERARVHVARRAWRDAEVDASAVLAARLRDGDAQPWEQAEARVVLATALPGTRSREARTLLQDAREVLAGSGPARALVRAEADRAWARVAITPTATADRHPAGDTR